MKPFVQFRIPGGRVTDIFENPWDARIVLQNRPFLDALKEASPHFFETIQTTPLTEDHQKSLYKYYSRWCTRCTPFGRFSGVLTADLSDKTSFNDFKPRFYSEPDIREKKKITAFLNETALSQTVFFANNSLYARAGKYYLLQYIDEKYREISLERFEALDAIIEAAGSGISYSKLVTTLEGYGFTKDECAAVIRELLEEQVIYSDYEFRQSETLEDYLHRLPEAILLESKINTPYTFTVYPNAEIDRVLIEKISADLRKVSGLFKTVPNTRLASFRSEFLRRFENREIPLLEILDPESGIPYGNYNLSHTGSILNELETPAVGIKKDSTGFQSVLLDKYIQCLSTGAAEITFTTADLNDLPPTENTSYYLFGSLLKNGTDFRFLLKQAGGSSAVNLMSRFSLGNPALANKLREITAWEQSISDALLAEVIHLPEGKIGNVVLHAPLRDYQICYLGHDSGNSLPLSDLLVSVLGDQVILRSQKLNKRVIPFLSHAHNYGTGLPVYSFLGDLQPAGAQFVFDWGALQDREFLPRVVFGQLILSRATWNLTEKNLERIKPSLPRHIALIESDNELYLDLEQPLCQKILRDYLRKNDTVRVTEFLYTPESCFIEGKASEIVIPVAGTKPNKYLTPSPMVSGKSYPPGSEWLYLKLYMSPKAADALLSEKVRPFVQLLKEKGLIQKWFFIRYLDPDFHLRLRFYHGSDPDFYKTVIALFHTHFLEELSTDDIHELQIAHYRPEYSRYPNMQEAEALFMQDSERVLERLASDSELYRLETSLNRAHDYLSGLTLPEKVTFCQTHRDAFLQEFGTDLKPRLNALYRQHGAWAKNILDTATRDSFPPLNPDVLPSYIHMHVNRNFISEARRYEMLIYHFLYRHYKSAQAKKIHLEF